MDDVCAGGDGAGVPVQDDSGRSRVSAKEYGGDEQHEQSRSKPQHRGWFCGGCEFAEFAGIVEFAVEPDVRDVPHCAASAGQALRDHESLHRML